MTEQLQQGSGDGFTSHIAGMSKQELYDIMCQMKALMDQNRPQARQILIDNVQLSRALFQAQIMLGMVRPPEVMPNIQETLSTPPSAHVGLQPNAQSVPVQGGLLGQATSSSQSVPARPQQPTQPPISVPTAPASPLNFQSQPLPSNHSHSLQQVKGLLNVPNVSLAPPPSPQIHNMPLPPPPAPSHYPVQPHVPMVSGQTQQQFQSPMPFQQPHQAPPLPQQPRPTSMQPFSHQPPQMSHSFQGVPQSIGSQTFHPASNPPAMFSTSFPPPQQVYQGGQHPGPDYGNHAGSSMHAERGAPWGPGQPENQPAGPQMPGLLPSAAIQMPPSTAGQPPRPPPLTVEMEQALLHQVMNLTPDQINLLPPEQRQQVLQLQQMLR